MWKPVERQRIAEEVARQLRSLILQGQYKAGDKLPPERKLSESLGVNRATLREALRNLEHMGLVRIRQGDGTRVLDFIQTAGLDLLGHMIPLSSDVRLGALRDILEFREVAGTQMARLAAGRATEEQIAALERVAARDAEDPEDVLRQDLDFYFELSRATGNLVFPLLYNPMRATVRRFIRFFASVNPEPEVTRKHHRVLIDAIRRRDADEAARTAARHLGYACEHLPSSGDEGPEIIARPDPDALEPSGLDPL